MKNHFLILIIDNESSNRIYFSIFKNPNLYRLKFIFDDEKTNIQINNSISKRKNNSNN